jgi:hypothetical protein
MVTGAGLEYGGPMDTARAVLCLAACGALVGASCKEQPEQPAVPHDAMRMRRFFQPPPGEVRAVPPHAIHADGVGPYMLGTSLRDVLGMLSRGPRVTLVQIDGVVDYSLVRAESGALIIGVEPLGAVAFVSVLDDEIARTESGIGVGTTSAELSQALGPALTAPDLAMSPGMAAFASLPNVRFLLDQPGGQVAAVVVRRARVAGRGMAHAVVPEVVPVVVPAVVPTGVPGVLPAGVPAPGSAAAPEAAPQAVPGQLDGAQDAGVRGADPAVTCLQGGELAGRVEEIARAAEVLRAEAESSLRFGCFSAGAAEALVHAGDRVVVVGSTPGAEAGPLRRLAVHSALGVAFAAPLDVDGDGRSEVAVVKEAKTEGETESERRVEVELLRLEGARFAPVAAGAVYRLSERSAAWVGASLGGIELLVELRAFAGDVLVSGLYAHRGPDGLDTVAPLLPAVIEVRRKRSGTAGVVPEAAAGRPRPGARPGPDGAGVSPGSGERGHGDVPAPAPGGAQATPQHDAGPQP